MPHRPSGAAVLLNQTLLMARRITVMHWTELANSTWARPKFSTLS